MLFSQLDYRKMVGLAVVALMLSSVLITAIVIQPTGANSDWWNYSWQYRKSIAIDHNKVAADLADFPVLIDITDSDLASEAQANGGDIAFTDYYRNKLDHEIEFFNGTTGSLVAWVRVPNLSSTSNTILYMYYGNPSASNQENPSGVWDSNYVMVQHLEETSGTHYDSTANDNDGTSYGGVTQDATGKIDGADNFDGLDDYVAIPDSMSLSPSNEITISMWVEAHDGVVAAKRNTKPENEYSWEAGIYHNKAYLRINANEHIAWSNDLPLTGWLVSSLYDGYLGGGHDVAVGPGEKYAYFLTFGGGRLSVINITHPENPSIVASTNTGIGADGLSGYNLVISGDMAYIAAYAPGGGVGRIVAYNISDPTNPVYKGHLQSSNYYAAHGIKVDPNDSNVVYMACYSTDSIVSFNVSDPTNIVQLDILTNSTYLDTIHDINVKGDYLYTTSGGAAASVDRFTVVDISNPNSMFVTSSIQDSNALHDSRGVDFSGDYAYVAMSNEGNSQGGLTIVNIADPNNPYVEGYIKTTETYYTHDVHYIGDNKVVGCQFHPDGVTLFNVTDKSNPTVIETATDHSILDMPHDGDVFSSGKYSIWACNGWVTIVENSKIPPPVTIPMVYIVWTYDKDAGSDQMKIYVNGTLDGTHTYSSVISDTLVDVTLARRYHLGAEAWYPGIIDEGRISNITRSAEWISTEYNNQQDPSSFYTIGTETKPAKLYIDPSVIEKTLDDVCTTFQVNVTIENVADLWGFEFNLTWDNNLITLVDVEFNTTLDNVWGPGDWFVGELMNVTGPGYYGLSAVSTSTGFTSTEPTALATLTFHVEDAPPGETSIHFTKVKLSNSEWQSIPVETTDGTYKITRKPTLQINPTNVTCRKYCENFTLTINVTKAYNLTDFQFEIHYNTTLLDYINMTWNIWGSGTTTVHEPDGNVTGYTSGTPITGNVTLVTVTFHASYYHIWKDLPSWTNNLTGTIYIQWANLSYPDIPDLHYEKGGLNEINVNPVEVVYTFAPIQGDVDNDGEVRVSDLRTVAAYYDQEKDKYNLTGDVTIDIYDLVAVAANYGYKYDC